jgi:hypothetical protein
MACLELLPVLALRECSQHESTSIMSRIVTLTQDADVNIRMQSAQCLANVARSLSREPVCVLIAAHACVKRLRDRCVYGVLFMPRLCVRELHATATSNECMLFLPYI